MHILNVARFFYGENMKNLETLKNKYEDYVNNLNNSVEDEKHKLIKNAHIMKEEYEQSYKSYLKMQGGVYNDLYLFNSFDEFNMYENWLRNGRYL